MIMMNKDDIINRSEIYKKNAYNLLEKLNIASLPIDLDYILQRLDIQKREFDIFDEETYDYSGCISIVNSKARIEISPLDPDTRQRFTIAHEIGHYLYDFPENLNDVTKEDSRITDKKFYRGNKSDPKEVRANRFASQLLMPKDMVVSSAKEILDEHDEMEADLFTRKMAEIFNVSMQAVEIRLSQLGIIK